MRSKPQFWAFLSLLLFAAAFWMWHYGNEYGARQSEERRKSEAALRARNPALSQASTTNASGANHRKSYRISNTTQKIAQLLHNSHALILRNALIDTEVPVAIKIPQHLRAKGAPGSYLVQADRPLDKQFYAELSKAGATYISYVPNNAALIQASPTVATNLAANADVVAVLPYEPYYKLDSALLPSAVEQQPQTNLLSVTTFPGQRDAALSALTQLGATLVGEDRSPFGPTLVVRVPSTSLVAVAQMPLAQEIEVYTPRHVANDLSRVQLGISANTLVGTSNYLGLTGLNVTVNINDTGVDSNHPDFLPSSRLQADFPASLMDIDGHGTHVAGIIAGNGSKSLTVPNPKAGTTNVPGSIVPGADFRGKATNAALFVQSLDLTYGPFISDSFLQQNASSNLGPTNLISNNSWGYASTVYDSHAASFDAATRDAQPNVDGEQPLLFVFAAGNNGGSTSDDGLDGAPGFINSPGTAKNVITVGAIDSPRNITNVVIADGTTNTPWAALTDNSNLVAGFSSCGNVGIGVEGTYGRFKPDVVAPGVFTISCRSSLYVDPTNSTNVTDSPYLGQVVDPGKTNSNYAVYIPPDTSLVVVVITSNAASPTPFPSNMLILADTFTPPTTLVSTNDFFVLTNFAPNDVWSFGVAPPKGQPGPVDYDLNIYLFETNTDGNYFTVLSNLNYVLQPWYLYDSGTSMSAGAVSGELALMQEFLQKRMNITNPSPALLKAMLINGSRSLNAVYDFNVNTLGATEQGWGMPNISNCVPPTLTNANRPMLLIDQSVSNSLATGQYQTYTINCSDTNAAVLFPLRITLVWTDPPGNPAAGVELVNNLDLTVSDNTGTNIYIGNDFLSGDIFTEVSNPTNLPPGPNDNTTQNIFVNNGTNGFTSAGDSINNVQNVYINPGNVPIFFPLTITVSGTRVNVNAVPGATNNITQDYALVISSDDPILTAPLTVTTNPIISVAPVLVTIASNGVPLLHQRVGANEPNLYNYPLGLTNGNPSQWHFFVFTNNQFSATNQATNVAFATFLPPNLSIPRASSNADIDLYVSTNPGLTNLIPSVVQAADKSLGREGTETVIYTNSTAGEVYYIGVKSEDQMAADFGFYGIAQQAPFSESSANGNTITATGTSLPVFIPNAVSPAPALIFAFMFNPNPIAQRIRRVTVTLGIQHPSPSDLYGTIQHNGITTVLNHNSGNTGGFTNTYDDLEESPSSGDVPSDPPGTLTEFVGQPADGLWLLTEADGALTQTGYVTTYSVSVDLQPPISGFFITIPGQSWFDDYIPVPNDATNLIIDALYENNGTNQAGSGPIGIYLTNNVGIITTSDYGSNNIGPPGGSLTLGTNNPPPGGNPPWPIGTPPLAGGIWYYGIYNSSTTPVTLFIEIVIQQSLTPNLVQTYTNSGVFLPLLTDAHTQSQICISNDQQLVDLQIGLVLQDTNTDDLSIHLISPEGTSVLLFENRGGMLAQGLGLQLLTTNGTTNLATNYVYTVFTDDTNLATEPIKFAPPPFAEKLVTPEAVLWSNSWETVTNGVYTNGAVLEGWQVTNDVVLMTTTNPPAYLTNDEVGIVSDPNGELIGTNSLGSNYLALTSGHIVQTFGVTNKFTITNGQPYELIFYAKPMGVVDWWPGDFNTDDIIGTNNGTIPYDDVTYNVGEVNNDFVFSGVGGNPAYTGNEVDFGTNAGNFGTNDFTVDFWIKVPNGQQGQRAIMEKRPECSDEASCLSIRSGPLRSYTPVPLPGQLDLEVSSDNVVNTYYFVGNKAINDGLFHHAAFTRKGTTLSIYVDGVLDTNRITPGIANISNSVPLRIGQNICVGTDGTLPFAGELDEIDLVDRALSPAEVYAIYHAGSLGKYSTNSILPNFTVTIDGVTTNNIILTNASENWQLITNSFTATNDEITVEFTGNAMGVLLDDIQLIQVPATNYNNYYLPEEPLTPFIGENPFGCWTLDIWDTRNDSSQTNNGELLSWSMQVTTSSTNASLEVLTNGEPWPTNVQPGSIQYFAVDVPPYVTFATNLFEVRGTVPLTLLFNQYALPTGTLPGDIVLTNQQPAGGPTGTFSSNVLSTVGLPPPLLPGQRYFLGVQNTSATLGRFTLTVNFNLNNSPIIPLTNGIPWEPTSPAIIGGFTGLQDEYYSFIVPTNAVMVTFQILSPTNANGGAGELDLYASDGMPLPGPFNFDYESCNASTNDQFIVVTTNTVPVPIPVATPATIIPLTPQTWYLDVHDTALTNFMEYTIIATYVTNGQMDIIPLTNAIPYTNTAVPGYPTNLLYSFTITNSPSGVEFMVTNLTNAGNVQLLADLDEFPTPEISIAGSFNPGTAVQFIQIVPNAALPSLNGIWYLSVPNTFVSNVAYTITAITNFIIPPPIEPLTWTGSVDDYWDILATSNWVITGSSPPTNYPYQNNSPVTFDDSATGTTSVYLSTTLSPASVTVNNISKSYTFFGPGSLTGTNGINMTGSGTAVFTESGGDNFSGGITNNGLMTYAASNVSVTGGVLANAGTLILDHFGIVRGPTTITSGATLQLGNNDAFGGTLSRPVTDNGSLVFNQSGSYSFINIISGTGRVSQIGSGVTSLDGSSSYTGQTLISSGTLIVDGSLSLGTWPGGAVTISGGGTLDLGGLPASGTGNPIFGTKQFNISSNGVGGIGAIVNDGPGQQLGGLVNLTLTGDAAIGGVTRWDMRFTGGTNTLNLGGYTLTKTGSNQISLVSTVVTPGNIVIDQGVLSFEVTPIFSPSNNTITVNTNGYVGQNADTFGSFDCLMILNGGGTTNLTGGGLTYLDAPIVLTNNSSLGNGGGTELFDGIISGPFGFTNLGPGTNLLWATNSYTGMTYIAQGTLGLTNNGSITNSTNITVAAGATFNAIERVDGMLTLFSNQSLLILGTNINSNLVATTGSAVSGTGFVISNLTVNPGASLSVGPDPLTIGTLTVVGRALLNGSNYMKINPALSPAQSNDVLTVSNVTYGGTLTVTNLGPTNSYFAGESFPLYNVSNSSGAFAVENLPPLPVGLVWSTTFGISGPGTIIVTTNQQPLISQFSVNIAQSTATFVGTNGVPGGRYVVLTSTNLAVPLASWVPVTTNYFDGLGDFNITNNLGTNGQQFYIIQSP